MPSLIETTHPEYTVDVIADWDLMHDTYHGTRAVKGKGEMYLPMPSGFKAELDGGKDVYERAYKKRAIVADWLSTSLGAMVGIIHGKEIDIQIPDGMSYLWEDANNDGMPLEGFHKEITRQLLLKGRYALAASAPKEGGSPYLVGYNGSSVINWDKDFYVVNESGFERDGFEWKEVTRYRVFHLVDGRFVSTLYEPFGEIALEDSGVDNYVSAVGGVPLDFVPFYVANSITTEPSIYKPPMIGIADAIITNYQLSADWRWQLYMSGQETLFIFGAESPANMRVGAGVVISLEGTPERLPDAKYVSPTCSGIQKHEDAMDKQREAAMAAGARMFENDNNTQESGDARKLRFSSETANLQTIAQSSCALLERGLRAIAVMNGYNPEDVIVTPPEDLLDNTMTAEDFAKLFDVYERGGMSWDTFYRNGKDGGIFSPEISAEDELALIQPTDESAEDNAIEQGQGPSNTQPATEDNQTV
jgi:hypothetical protein